MSKIVKELIDNESGLILSAEMVLILTIAVLGVVVGLSQVQQAVVAEFQDLSLAFYGLNQSYATPSFAGCWKWWGRTSFSSGSGFIDYYDGCIGPGAMGGGGYMMGGGYAEIGAGMPAMSYGSYGTVPNAVLPSASAAGACEVCTPSATQSQPTPVPDSSHPTPNPPPPATTNKP